MSRPVISGVIAAIIALLTAVAYFVTTSSIEKDIERDARRRVAKAQELLIQNSSLEMLALLKDTEQLAHDPDVIKSLTSGSGPNSRQAELAFQKFRAKLAGDGDKKQQRRPPDIMALTDENGKLVALMSGDKPVFNPIPDTYFRDGKVKYPALARAIEQRQITSEVWDYENLGPMKAGVAPVYDKEIDNIAGTVILAYAMSAVEAKEQEKLLGTDVAYFYGDRVSATSMGPAGSEKKGGKAGAIRDALFKGDKPLAAAAFKSDIGLSEVITIDIEGDDYWASAGRMPRFSTQPFPQGYPDAPAGAMVMMSRDAELAPLATVKVAILLVGLGSIVVALLGMFIAARRILHPLDEIETGVNDIINGNLERTFRPVGSDLDGLANALNVLLARLLGRPEPGEEEYDEEGNVIRPSGLAVDTEGLSQQDAEAVSLAAEPEGQYLQRTYEQYVAARRQTGEGTQGIDYDGFVAKLRQNESVLKGKYQCRAVRFKVVTKDGKVTLKPVPIV